LFVAGIASVVIIAPSRLAQSKPGARPEQQTPTHANILRGEYGRYRATTICSLSSEHSRRSGKEVRQRQEYDSLQMLKDDTRIQLDLYDNLKIDKIEQMFGAKIPR
jgi:hypothetical protein